MKKNFLNRLIVILLALTLAAVLVGCSNGETESGGNTASTAQAQRIRLLKKQLRQHLLRRRKIQLTLLKVQHRMLLRPRLRRRKLQRNRRLL